MVSEIETLIEERVESASRRGGFTEQDFAHLKKHIVQKHATEIAEAACSLIEKHGPRSSSYYTIQEIVGRLLVELQPPISMTLEAALTRVLDTWDPSVEQYPIYLGRVFGSDAVLRILHEIEAGSLSPRARQSVKTMRWWLTAKNG